MSKSKKTNEESSEDIAHLEERLAEIRLMKEKIIGIHDKINEALNNKDLLGAVKGYKQLKKLCQDFPKELSQERIALLAEALSVYEKIKALKDETGGKISIDEKSNTSYELKKDNALSEPNPVDGKHVDPVQKIRDDIGLSQRIIEELLVQKNIKDAMREYTRLKMLCKIFPKAPNPEEKISVLASALAVFEKIKRTKDSIEREKKADEMKRAEDEYAQRKFEEFRSELDGKISHVKEFLSQKDTQSAIAAYADMKNFFNTYPDEPFEKKKLLYDDILNAHLDMALLDKDFKNKSIVQADAKIKEIRDGLISARELAASNRNEEVTNLILELKHKSMLLPSEEFDQKYNFIREIDDLEHRASYSSNIQKMDMQGGLSR
jgi:hypothetical protein